MTDKIESALSAEEWAIALHRKSGAAPSANTPVRRIAMDNASLPDTDPRKMTRDRIDDVRVAARQMPSRDSESNPGLQERLLSLADALESYLPPSDD
jgi:hypothetical protein